VGTLIIMRGTVETRYRSTRKGEDIVHTVGNHGICEIKRVLPFAGASPAAPTKEVIKFVRLSSL